MPGRCLFLQHRREHLRCVLVAFRRHMAEFFLIKIVISCDEIGIAARQRLERHELIDHLNSHFLGAFGDLLHFGQNDRLFEHQLASFSSGGSSAIGNDNFNERNLERPQVTALSQPAFE